MANTGTTYLGLNLKNPLVAGASTLTEHADSILRLEDAGIGAVVLRSMFEEEITADVADMYHELAYTETAFAMEYLRADLPARLGPEASLNRLAAIKKRVGIPVIASCNCLKKAQWVSYARKIEQAGADALELNLYRMPLDATKTSETVEARDLDTVRAVVEAVKIPVAVKLSPYYTALIPFAFALQQTGVKGLVLFNRFLQTDIDIDREKFFYRPDFTTPDALPLQLRWTAVLRNILRTDLALSGGIHSGRELIKSLLVGANVGYICSALYQNLDHKALISGILSTLNGWMETKAYAGLDAFRGKLRETDLTDGEGFERNQYTKQGNGEEVFGVGTQS